ncbi:MAG TPA: Ig-like domain-containing protein [Gemmatimonadaceae bacterium]|nr:Ig-like domain-containing protein [Gemmatimonadaceae bacterium]
MSPSGTLRLAAALALALAAACSSSTESSHQGPPARLDVTSGDGQTATVGAAVATPLSVRVSDANGKPVSGVSVAWTVSAGNGTVAPISPSTDASGLAQANFTVGTIAGVNQVTASVSGVTTASTFTITGTAGPAAKVAITPHTVALGCGLGSAQVSAAVQDRFGNAASGSVTWTSRNPAVATVDAAGKITLLSTSGSTYVIASGQGLSADSVAVGASAPLALQVGQVIVDPPTNGVCVTSDAPGSQFTLVAYFNSSVPGNSVGIEAYGDGLATYGGNASLGNQVASTALLPALDMSQQRDEAFDLALRRRERAETPKYLPMARAWLAQREQAGTGARADVAPSFSSITSSSKVGDLVQLNTNSNDYCTNPTLTTGRIAAISNSAVVVADTSNPAGGFTDAQYASFAVGMDTLVNPVDTTAFGTPYNIDGTGKVIIFFTKAVNQLTPNGGANGVVLGFYYSRDLYPKTSPTGNCPGSNFANMFYLMVPDVNRTINGGNSYSSSVSRASSIVLSTIGHEYQHLINASRRMYVNKVANVDEDTWLNEGLSHVAEELMFYRSAQVTPRQDLGTVALSNQAVFNAFQTFMTGNYGRYSTYLTSTESQAPVGVDTDDDLATRGAIWSFLRYAADRTRTTDGDFWFQLVNTPLTGVPNLEHVIGPSAGMFRDWATSVYADDYVPGVVANYTQPSWNFRQIVKLYNGQSFSQVGRILVNDVTQSVTLTAQGVSFLRFTVPNGKQGTLRVTGVGGSALPAGVQLMLVRDK